MAMIKCPECGKEISDRSEKCINCGYPLNVRNRNPNGIKIGIIVSAIVIMILITIGVVGIIIVQNSLNSKNTITEEATETCKAEGCDNPVYSNGYCIIHYGDVRSGDEVRVDEKSSNSLSQKSDAVIEEDEVKAKNFTKNTKISTETCEFTMTGYTIASKIEPSTNEAYYHYFEAGPGNVFVDVKFSIKNTSSSAIGQDKVLRGVKVIYNNNYEYNCSCATVESNGDFNSFPSLYPINPLATMQYHMLAEVPSEVKSSSGSLIVRVDADGQLYECRLR